MSETLRTAAGVSALIWSGALALAAYERRVAHDLDDAPAAAHGPMVTVVVPARDEERGIGRAVASLRGLEHDPLEIIVVDDQSRDGTLAAARRAAAGDPRVRVIAGEPLPEGWVGKSWACWQAACQARGDWLLFTDADVVHAPDSLGRALALAERLGRGGLSLLPQIDAEGVAERAVLPAALTAIGTFVAPGPLARSPRSRVAMAAGGYILLRRELYDAVGGHAAIRTRMVDDVCLAAAVKRAGSLLVLAPAGDRARLRMYHGAREVWRGWSKNASFGAAGGAGKGLAGAGVLAALAVGPAIAAALGARRRDVLLGGLGLVGVGAQIGLQRVSVWAVPTPPRYAPTQPLGLLVLAGAAARGAIARMRGHGPEWRGRRYPLAR